MLLREIADRRSLRSITGEPIAAVMVGRLIEAATLAPSCFNNQPWRFVAVTDAVLLEKIRAVLPDGNAWARSSPLIILALTKPSLDCRMDEGRDYAFFDLGLAVMNMLIQAEHEGIVAHPIAGFNPKKVKQICAVDEDFVLVTLIVCGNKGENSALSDWQRERETGPRQRKAVGEICFRDSFGLPFEAS